MELTRRRLLQLTGYAAAGLSGVSAFAHLSSAPVYAQAAAGATTFKGDSTTTSLGPVPLNAGLTVMRVQFNGGGSGNFSANIIQPEPGQGPTGGPVTGGFNAFFNNIGAFKGGAAALVSAPGSYYITVSATGAFQLSIEQPLPENVTTVQQTSFSGKGPDVSPYFMLPSSVSQITCQTPAPQLVAYLYHIDDLGGSAIVAGVQGQDGSLFDFRDPSNQTAVPLSLPDSGPYLVVVANIFTNDSRPNSWTVSFA